ncbi:hypothetical protein CONPUDRAFT_112949 [Coniophora puteana RWD-64-598 SS2]|uniref:Vacuolar calcium ion transporter n=1 Tax=Coniophora puteana (strain RWD-64-598) TaxID=741705 RepID=A0A5M3M815_CONPW|nr:uncharacterized protein CONPUDRAFT_112949 [Coniophora puteana RWD-64-598 SS2]EIW75014.1 hypothetical protein CONPUDRAFT_112949 [Coniophora puteana RWD-64-598 SS2]
MHFLRIIFRSGNKVSCAVNLLWPAVPAAIAVHFVSTAGDNHDYHLATFVLNYIAMVPAANTIGFAGQELARKLPKVIGVVLETVLGGIVEIVLFIVLIKQGAGKIPVIRAAILGSVLANLLLCLGLCFVAGGAKREEQEFHPAVSEVGSGLMLVAGMALVVPTIFVSALSADSIQGDFASETLSISRGTSIVLLIAFFIYMYFQLKTHHGLYDEILEYDELRDKDAHKDRVRPHLTLFESIAALVISITCVSMIAVFLVEEIDFIVEERHVKDAFVGLILVPLVEKAAEHLTAVDEAYDDQMNFALSHVLGASVQTVLFNTPLVVIIGWGIGVPMDLNFAIFDAVVLVLAILVVGSFLRDGKSNYLEGALCVLTYVIIAICAFFYPNPDNAAGAAEVGGEAAGEAAAVLVRAFSG